MPYVFRRRVALPPRRKRFATSGPITITLGGATGSFASSGVAARFALLHECDVAMLAAAGSNLTGFGDRLVGAIGAYSINPTTAAFRVAINGSPGGHTAVGGAAALVTRLLSGSGTYAATANIAPLGVLMLSANGDLDVTGSSALFARDFEAWFPRPFDADGWTHSPTESSAWIPDAVSLASWSLAAKQAENWTPAVKQPKTWDAE
jgi:hypothetical protein